MDFQHWTFLLEHVPIKLDKHTLVWSWITGNIWDEGLEGPKIYTLEITISEHREMFAAYSVILLCLVAASQSAPPVCEKLVEPLDQVDPRHLEGGLAIIAGSVNNSLIMEALKVRDSITAYFSNTSETEFSYTQINRIAGQCLQRMHYNISIQDSTFTFEVGGRFELNGSFLYTSCPDCVVMRWVVRSARRNTDDLYLLSRRRKLRQEEMEEFTAQAGFLQLPSPVVMDPTKKLCLDRHPPDRQTDSTSSDWRDNRKTKKNVMDVTTLWWEEGLKHIIIA